MDNKTIKAALRGDPDAAAECTVEGIAINCPFCSRLPRVLERPDSLDGYFCAVACYCGGYSANAHQSATHKASAIVARTKAIDAWNRRVRMEGN